MNYKNKNFEPIEPYFSNILYERTVLFKYLVRTYCYFVKVYSYIISNHILSHS